MDENNGKFVIVIVEPITSVNVPGIRSFPVENGLTTLPDMDIGMDSDSNYKPEGCIVLCRTYSNCTDSDPYFLFLNVEFGNVFKQLLRDCPCFRNQQTSS